MSCGVSLPPKLKCINMSISLNRKILIPQILSVLQYMAIFQRNQLFRFRFCLPSQWAQLSMKRKCILKNRIFPVKSAPHFGRAHISTAQEVTKFVSFCNNDK